MQPNQPVRSSDILSYPILKQEQQQQVLTLLPTL
jgi:hypothetical protein